MIQVRMMSLLGVFVVIFSPFSTKSALAAQSSATCIDLGTTLQFVSESSTDVSTMTDWYILFEEFGSVTLIANESLISSNGNSVSFQKPKKLSLSFLENGSWEYLLGSTSGSISKGWSQPLNRDYWDWGTSKMKSEMEISVSSSDGTTIQIESIDKKWSFTLTGKPQFDTDLFYESVDFTLDILKGGASAGKLLYKSNTQAFGGLLPPMGVHEYRAFTIPFTQSGKSGSPAQFERKIMCEAPTLIN